MTAVLTALVFLAALVYLFIRWLRTQAIEVRPFDSHADQSNPVASVTALQHQLKVTAHPSEAAQGTEQVKRLCLAYLQGQRAEISAAESALLPMHVHSQELIRHLEIAFESLAIIEKTKNPETLTSRLSVARQNLNQANAEAPEVFDQVHCDELIAILDEAASGRLADIAIGKVEAFKAKACTAKTEPTRAKNLSLAKDHAAEAARHPNISTADRKRIRESARA